MHQSPTEPVESFSEEIWYDLPSGYVKIAIENAASTHIIV